MKKIQTVYIPSEKGTTDSVVYKNLGTSGLQSFNVTETEAYVFTPEELKQLLQDYTDRIVGNVNTIFVEDVCPLTGQEFVNREVDKKSITEQLSKFLKENNLCLDIEKK